MSVQQGHFKVKLGTISDFSVYINRNNILERGSPYEKEEYHNCNMCSIGNWCNSIAITVLIITGIYLAFIIWLAIMWGQQMPQPMPQ